MRELIDNRSNEIKENDYYVWLDLPNEERKVFLFDSPTKLGQCLIDFADFVHELIIAGNKARIVLVKWNDVLDIKNVREVRLEDYSSYVG